MNHTRTITQFIVDEFLPDVGSDELAPDYDLLATGVIDSLGLLKVIAWIEDRFGIDGDEIDLVPENFRSVDGIRAVIERAGVPQTAGRP
jgi:acyl carrier protein